MQNLKPIILGNFKSLYGEDLTAVALGMMADVDPAHTLLVDELVERQLQLLNELEEAAVLLQRTGCTLDIGGTACHVVGRRGTSDHGVKTGATVAAADINGLSVGLAQGVEDVPDQAVDVVGFLQRRQPVIDAVAVGSSGTDKLADGEITHGLPCQWCLIAAHCLGP